MRIVVLVACIIGCVACSSPPQPVISFVSDVGSDGSAMPDAGIDAADSAVDVAGEISAATCDLAACTSNNPCTIASCLPNGKCKSEALSGVPCGAGKCSGLSFQGAGTCQAGVCAPVAIVTCDDGNGCTLDTCSAGGCSHMDLDGNVCGVSSCTGLEHHPAALCKGGGCQTLAAVKCDDGDPCTLDGCGANVGCTHLASGGPCEDGDACTQGEHCTAGKCKGGKPADCSDGNPCTADACATGKGCGHVAQAGPCQDGDPCTSGDSCSGGACAPGIATDCADGNECTLDTCDNTGGCQHATVPAACDDGNLCTADGCGAGKCTHSAIAAKCQEPGCAGNAFSPGAVCKAGACVKPPATSCDDANPCTTDACNTKGCSHVDNADGCEDGDACSQGDACAGGKCKAGGATACSDGNPCTLDGCSKGACISTPVPNAAPCDDGLACTVQDVCNDGECQGKPAAPLEKVYGTANPGVASAVAMLADGFALAGLTGGQGAGDTDAWLIRTDSDGKSLWKKTFGGKADDRAFDVAAVPGGLVLAGLTVSSGAGNADAWLVHTDADGGLLWAQTYGGAQFDAANGVAVLGSAGFALAGFTYSYGAGLSDAWLLRTDPAGKLLWSQTYGGVGEDGAYAVAALADGGFALAGVTDPGNTLHDAWLLRTDASGTLLWSQAFGGGDSDGASTLVALVDGFALAGYTTQAGAKDAWLVRTDLNGQLLWDKKFGGAADDEAFGLTTLPGGGFALAGATASSGSGGTDAWLLRTDSTGKLASQTTFGSAQDDVARGLVATAKGVVLVGAKAKSAVDTDAWWMRVPDACGP